MKLQPLFSDDDPLIGGSTLFRGHVFVEGYFRVVGLTERIKRNVGTAQLAKEQVWLKWNARTKAYTVERGGAHSVLLAPYVEDGKVRLYRGLDGTQVELLERLKGGDENALQQLFTDKRDALFFAPDEEVAKLWSRGCYVELSLREADLAKVYAGVEQDYVEVAIPDPQVLVGSIESLMIHPMNAQGDTSVDFAQKRGTD